MKKRRRADEDRQDGDAAATTTTTRGRASDDSGALTPYERVRQTQRRWAAPAAASTPASPAATAAAAAAAANDEWLRALAGPATATGHGPGQPPLRTVHCLDMHTGGEPVRVVMAGWGTDSFADSEAEAADIGSQPKKPKTVLDWRRWLQTPAQDRVRRALMWEPRGHADMYGLMIVPPERHDSAFGVIFMHNAGYSTMCGHATIAIALLARRMGWVPAGAGTGNQPARNTPVDVDGTTASRSGSGSAAGADTDAASAQHGPSWPAFCIDAPCGQLTITAAGNYSSSNTNDSSSGSNDNCDTSEFLNVPSFVAALDCSVHVPGIGPVVYDLAYGGAFYAYVDLRRQGQGRGEGGGGGESAEGGGGGGGGGVLAGLTLAADKHSQLADVGRRIKRAVIALGRERNKVVHPFDDDLSFLYGVIFVDAASPARPGVHSRNVCVFADGEVDRSATGSGVSGRAALLHARGELKAGDAPIRIESIVGSEMTVAIDRVLPRYGPFTNSVIVPRVAGRAHVYGRCEFVIGDGRDPLGDGFFLR